MSEGELIVIALRLVIPLLILRYPLFGGITAMVLDALDVVLIEAIGLGGFGGHYSELDKLLDSYYLTLEVIVAFRWTSAWARIPAIVLYVYRAIGVVAFETTDTRVLLLVFPNLFENWWLYVRDRGAVLPAALSEVREVRRHPAVPVARAQDGAGVSAALPGSAALGLDEEPRSRRRALTARRVTMVQWYRCNAETGKGRAMTEATSMAVERVQLGVRMEKRMVKVLKGLAEFEGITLGQLLEKIVLHSFEPVLGQEGEMSASPHGKKALAAIADLKRIYGMDWDTHATRRFLDDCLDPELSDGAPVAG